MHKPKSFISHNMDFRKDVVNEGRYLEGKREDLSRILICADCFCCISSLCLDRI